MTVSKIADVSFTESSRAVIPFVGSMVFILLITIFVPQFSTFLPKLLMGINKPIN